MQKAGCNHCPLFLRKSIVFGLGVFFTELGEKFENYFY